MTRLAVLAALLPLVIVLGSGTVERSSAPRRGTEPIGPIYGEHVVSQIFTPTSSVIAGIDVRLATYARRNNGMVTLRLRQAGGTEDLRTASVPASEIRDSALHRFRFDPIEIGDSERGVLWRGTPPSLEFRIESNARDVDNAIAVWGREERSEMVFFSAGRGDASGLASYDGVNQGKDLLFAPIYREPAVLAAGAAVWRLVAGGLAPLYSLLTLILPGLLLARLFLRRDASHAAVLAAAPAFGLAGITLLTLWTGTVSVRTNHVVPPLLALASGVALVLPGVTGWRRGNWAWSMPALAVEMGAGAFALGAIALGAIALGAIALGLAFRAIALEGLATPPGADSYHHALITQLIMERGGVPSSYAPYAPIDSFAYHFGFHATAAWMGRPLELDGLQAIAIAGPLLNCLAALSIFGLVLLARLGRVAASVAAIVTALVSPFPMWFLDVGRYPQEAALVVFPIAAAFALGFANQRTGKIATASVAAGGGSVATSTSVAPAEGLRFIVGGALLAAGLFLSHYRIALMLLVLICLHLAWTVLAGRRPGFAVTRAELTRCAGILVGAALLVAPWIVRLAQAFTLGIRGSEGRYAPDYYNLERLGTALSHPAVVLLAILAIVGAAVALVRRAPLVGLLSLWGTVLLVASNPRWLPVPGAGALDSVTVISSLYVVGAVGIGYLVQRVWDVFGGSSDSGSYPPPQPSPTRGEGVAGGSVGPLAGSRSGRHIAKGRRLAHLMLIAGVSWMAGWGALQLPTLVRPEQSLAAAGDLKAAKWIDSSLPADARFLVNATIVNWEPDFVEPTDGGSWLPLLAHRPTTLLPLVYAGERGAAPADIDRMERIARAARVDVAAPATLRLLRESGVTHVYLGVYGGPIDETKLAGSPAFRRVYALNGVSIYELLGSGGE